MKTKLLVYALAVVLPVLGVSVSAQSYAVTNVKIVTGKGQTIERGTVVVRDGLIQEVGANAKAPADATVFDGTNLTIYPGFIDTYSNLGIAAPPPQQPRQGAARFMVAQPEALTGITNYPEGLRPEYEILDELKSGDAQFESARNAGFTTAVITGRTGIFTGSSAIINLAGDRVSAMLIKSPASQHIQFVTLGGMGYPNSLLGTFSALRQLFLDAQRQQKLEKQFEGDQIEMRRPEIDVSLRALYPVLNGEIPVVFNANQEKDINRALDLAKEFNIKTVIAGGQEAWKLTDKLKAQNAAVLLSLNFPKRTAAAAPDADPETLETLRFRAETPKAAGRLAQAGVKFAFQTGGATNMNDVIANAAKSVENGLTKDAAIRAFTVSGAEIFGIDNLTGSIEKGKIANLTVVRGDVFAKDRAVTHVFIDGKPFEIKQPERPATPPVRPGQPTTPGTPPATTPTTPPALPNVAGNYSITIDIPGQPLPGTLIFTQTAAELTGTLQTQMGAANIRNGKVDADGFAFDATVVYNGMEMELNVSGKVTGTQISGTITTAQGPVTFSGTKNP